MYIYAFMYINIDMRVFVYYTHVCASMYVCMCVYTYMHIFSIIIN